MWLALKRLFFLKLIAAIFVFVALILPNLLGSLKKSTGEALLTWFEEVRRGELLDETAAQLLRRMDV